MTLRRTLAFALLVAVAGCAGAGIPSGGGDAPTTTETTAETTEHTAQGTAHAGNHFTVRVWHDVENVTVTLAPYGQTARYTVDAGPEQSFTREIHDRGHDVRVVVERDGEVVFDKVVRDYQHYQLTVRENETSVTQSVV